MDVGRVLSGYLKDRPTVPMGVEGEQGRKDKVNKKLNHEFLENRRHLRLGGTQGDHG